jgi:hypothetical protein
MNTRTLVSLPDDDKQWLDAEAAVLGRPMTHLVQDAVAEYLRLATRNLKDFRPARFPFVFAPYAVRRAAPGRRAAHGRA